MIESKLVTCVSPKIGLNIGYWDGLIFRVLLKMGSIVLHIYSEIFYKDRLHTKTTCL